MSIVLEVVRHGITDEYPWPQDVSDLFHCLSRPLPKLLASNQFQMALTRRTREMLETALQSSTLVLEDEENSYGEVIPVTDVVDAVLSSVRMVKAASAFGRGGEQAQFSWTTLITMLGMTISEKVYIAEDISFLMPRTTKRLIPRDSNDLEGKAVILLSVYISRSIRLGPRVNASEGMKSARSSELGCPAEDPFATLDLPLGAYVLPGRGKRVECCLPVVCAADEDEIESLVTSVVCQRYVWRIPTPVVGVSLSKTGTTAAIVIGWSEVDTGNPDASPIIHLALSKERDDIRLSLGIFDLNDPVIEQLSKNRDTRDLCWRLDQFPPFSRSIEPDTLVETWLRSLPSAANARPSILHRLRSVFTFMSSKNPGSSGKNRSTSTDYLKVPPSPLHRSASGSSLAKSYSASEFVALRAENGLAAMEPGTDTWLWERCTLRLFRLKLPTDVKSDFSKQFNGMIDLYDQLTEFCWPREWNGDASFLPHCDRPSQWQRADLFKEYEQYIKDGNPAPQQLEANVTASVADHMTTFLRAVSTSQTCRRQAAFSGAGESTMRSAWDELFKAACCDPMQDVSDTFFVEKSIGLPKNQAFGNANFPDIFQSRLLLLLLMKQSGVAIGQRAILNSFVSAVQQAVENEERSDLGTFNAQERFFEPSTALVDGLYCLEYRVDQTTMARGTKAADKFPSWFHSFFSLFKNPSKPKCTEGKNHTFEYQEPSTKEKKMTFNDAHAECLMCPEVTNSLPNPSPFSVEADNMLRFYLPFIFVENKRVTKSLRQALHQCQMCCTFGVEFLAALGITDFPVFGVITAGTEGEVIMAWKSSKSVEADYRSSYRGEKVPQANARQRFNVLVDQNCRKFDLASPLQAFHFFITIHRIFKRQELLAKEVRKKSTELARIWKDPQNELHNWMMKPKIRTTKPTSKSEPATK